MRKSMVLLLAVVVSFGMLACDKSKEGGAGAEAPKAGEAKAAKSGGMFGAFDPAAELKALEGKWKVKDSAFAKEPSLWEIHDGKIKVQRGDKTIEGELEIKHPGQLALVEKSNGGSSRSYFAYARSAADVYIGLGKAGVKMGDSYYVSASDGVVVKDATTCKYYKKKMFGGFDSKPVDVKCQLKDEGGKKLLSYETPDRFKKGKMKQGKVELKGDALLNQQMLGHKVEKVQ